MFTDLTELLYTLAEVTIAFVGFSTIVAALRARSEPAFRIYSIRDVAIVGLMTLAGICLPLTLQLFIGDAPLVWRLSSVTFSIFWIATATWGIRSYRQAVPINERHRALKIGPIFGIAGNGLLWFNVFWPTAHAGPLYVVALILLLIFMSISFVVATFHKLGNGSEPGA
jgi:hypothetical protein